MTRTELINFMGENARGKDEIQLNTCQAWIINCGNYAILKSYSTLVALYSDLTGTVYVLDRYSTTTDKHVAKFMKEVNAMRAVYLYRRSDGFIQKDLCGYCCNIKLNKSDFEYVKELDFITYIENKLFCR